MPRNAQVVRQWLLLERLERSKGATLEQLVESLPPDATRHPRTIRRDLEALEARFPLVTERRHGKTVWRLMDGFHRSLSLAFSRTEGIHHPSTDLGGAAWAAHRVFQEERSDPRCRKALSTQSNLSAGPYAHPALRRWLDWDDSDDLIEADKVGWVPGIERQAVGCGSRSDKEIGQTSSGGSSRRSCSGEDAAVRARGLRIEG